MKALDTVLAPKSGHRRSRCIPGPRDSRSLRYCWSQTGSQQTAIDRRALPRLNLATEKPTQQKQSNLKLQIEAIRTRFSINASSSPRFQPPPQSFRVIGITGAQRFLLWRGNFIMAKNLPQLCNWLNPFRARSGLLPLDWIRKGRHLRIFSITTVWRPQCP